MNTKADVIDAKKKKIIIEFFLPNFLLSIIMAANNTDSISEMVEKVSLAKSSLPWFLLISVYSAFNSLEFSAIM